MYCILFGHNRFVVFLNYACELSIWDEDIVPGVAPMIEVNSAMQVSMEDMSKEAKTKFAPNVKALMKLLNQNGFCSMPPKF